MWMMQEILPPGVEHGEEADLSPQMLRIGGNGLQSLGRCPEEDAIDHRLVLIGDVGNRFRHRQDDVKVLRGEKLGPSVVQPLSAGQ
jgi:hypothetical protein